MSKEKINIGELFELHDDCCSLDQLDGFVIIDEKQIGFDSEKSIVNFVTIIQRNSDKKFFKVNWREYSQGDDDLTECEGIEVKQYSKTTYYYK